VTAGCSLPEGVGSTGVAPGEAPGAPAALVPGEPVPGAVAPVKPGVLGSSSPEQASPMKESDSARPKRRV
jgi:hypothetical protein